MKISAVIITHNEERNIERCLKSVMKVADEIIVVDSNSTDKTEEICKTFGVNFVFQKWLGYGEQKNFANSLAKYEYILSLDADEVLSEKLQSSILETKQNFTADAYNFNRLTFFYGKPVKHCGWYPDRKIRLFNKQKAHWEGNVHETLIFPESFYVKFLAGDLLHYTTDNLFSQIEKINKYSDSYAISAVAKGKKANLLKLISKPKYKFFHVYFIKLGFLDGWNGFLISCLSALDAFFRLCKMRMYQK
jgi:glycosyltransferase involved in cell wall biosynthesis